MATTTGAPGTMSASPCTRVTAVWRSPTAGIEMGQGINTKVAQVVAKELGVDLDMVRVKPSNNFANVNGSVTGGGMGSECNCSVSLMARKNFSFGAVSMLRVLLNVKERKGLAPFGFILFPVSLELFAFDMKINCN